MKRLILLLCLLTGAFVGSCQCSDKPPVPPVDETRASADAQHEIRAVEVWT